MIELTVGYVSGFISLAATSIQLCIPTLIVVILVALLRDENSAVTWSVAGRAIQNSCWPTILAADTAACRDVRRRIVFITYFSTFVLILIAVAGVVTPLGLYDGIFLGDTVQKEFHYVRDTSPMGYGTQPGNSLEFITRYVSLPDSLNLLDLFGSGTREYNNTVSNIWDIQWRQYQIRKHMNGVRFFVGTFRQLQSLVLNNAVEPREGLIVNTEEGGIGFRNHTMPLGLRHGATWSEDLLFIEPKTQCVDLNITLDRDTSGQWLTDRGGFANLSRNEPFYERADPQANPDLWGRAYKAAWLHNYYIMLRFNLTNPVSESLSYMNSQIGERFPTWDQFEINFNALVTTSRWEVLHNLVLFPWKAKSYNFNDINAICSGDSADTETVSGIAVYCGMVYGAARRADGSASTIPDYDSEWTIPLYSCASAARAVVKEVTFQMNGTDSLQNLVIVSLKDKEYLDKQSMPIWGFMPTPIPGLNIKALWGLIAPEIKDSENLLSVQKESFWLPEDPAVKRDRTNCPSKFYFNTAPGINFHVNANYFIYGIQPIRSHVSNSCTEYVPGRVDYTGETDMGMFAKWQELSRTASTTAKILNLVWTDVAANMVVGTKSRFSSLPLNDPARSNSSSNGESRPLSSSADEGTIRWFPVQEYVHRVQYRILFGIPAFLLLFLAALIFLTAFVLLITGRFKLQQLKRHLRETSAGRLMALIMFSQEAEMHTSTKEWVRVTGRNSIKPTQLVPTARKSEMSIACSCGNRFDVQKTSALTEEISVGKLTHKRGSSMESQSIGSTPNGRPQECLI